MLCCVDHRNTTQPRSITACRSRPDRRIRPSARGREACGPASAQMECDPRPSDAPSLHVQPRSLLVRVVPKDPPSQLVYRCCLDESAPFSELAVTVAPCPAPLPKDRRNRRARLPPKLLQRWLPKLHPRSPAHRSAAAKAIRPRKRSQPPSRPPASDRPPRPASARIARRRSSCPQRPCRTFASHTHTWLASSTASGPAR